MGPGAYSNEPPLVPPSYREGGTPGAPCKNPPGIKLIIKACTNDRKNASTNQGMYGNKRIY